MVDKTVVHFEIPAEDVERLKRFYEGMFSWKITHTPVGSMDYWLIETVPINEKGEPIRPGINGGMYKKENPQQVPNNYISVDDIARESDYSLSHFTRLFMGLTGKTPGAYLRKRRLEEAARDILAGKKILDTALDYHFSSQEAFTRSFKMQYNVTPRFYVKLSTDMGDGMLGRIREADMIKKLENLRWPSRWTPLSQ